MATSIIEKVLGNNRFYTDSYIRETITFVKSIVVKNDKEAQLYNDLIKLSTPSFTPELRKADWRYYRHIVGLTYHLDRPVTIVSVDNGETITLNKEILQIHRRTHEELLKFELYYEKVVKTYPELELYIKGVITTPVFHDVQKIIDAEDYTITSYNPQLVEPNEHNLISQLQLRIYNYKNTWLIGFYAMADNLFLASQYHILYNFLVTSLLAIRLAAAKTNHAHSYHIRLYLASHHYLDDSILFLTKEQQLFLYRNMLYLDNHSGSNFTFQTLIDVLFSARNISVINYVFKQRNTTDTNALMQYRYKQKLLNSKKLVVNTADVELQTIAAKERPLAPGNNAVYDYHFDEVDFKHRNSLFSELLSKDLETVLLDETDSVRYKLIQTLTDYWAKLLQSNRMSFLVEVVDPVTSLPVRLSAKDLFKLYLIVVNAVQGTSIQQFPAYRIQRVFKDQVPDQPTLLRGCYQLDKTQQQYVQDVIDVVPSYQYYLTSYQFEQFVSQIYKLNIGLWHLLSNYSNKNTEGQMHWVIDRLHETSLYEVDTVESVNDFIDRIGIEDPRKQTLPQLQSFLFEILDNAYDKKLSFLSRYQKLQDALTKVFFKFNSYTVQLMNNYYGDSPYLVGTKDTRYDHHDTVYYDLSLVTESTLGFDLVTDQTATLVESVHQRVVTDIRHHSKLYEMVDLDQLTDIDMDQGYSVEEAVPLPQAVLTETDVQARERVDAVWLRTSTFLSPPESYLSSEANFDIKTTVMKCSLLTENVQRLIPINADFDTDNNNWNTSQSSDPDLLFIALNPK